MERRTRSGRVAAPTSVPANPAPSKVSWSWRFFMKVVIRAFLISFFQRGRPKKSEIDASQPTEEPLETSTVAETVETAPVVPAVRRRGRPSKSEIELLNLTLTYEVLILNCRQECSECNSNIRHVPKCLISRIWDSKWIIFRCRVWHFTGDRCKC